MSRIMTCVTTATRSYVRSLIATNLAAFVLDSFWAFSNVADGAYTT